MRRVVSDLLPAAENDRANLVDPLIGNRADQLRVAELPADREVDDEIRLVDIALDLPLAVVHADVEAQPRLCDLRLLQRGIDVILRAEVASWLPHFRAAAKGR